MMTLVSLIGFAVFVLAVAGLYLWTRHSESSYEYETGNQSSEQADANRLGIALSINGTYSK